MPIELLKENLVVRRIGDEYFLLTSGDTMLHNVRGSGVFSLEAIESLTGIKVTDLVTAQGAAEHLLAWPSPVVIITLGADGALLATSSQVVHAPARKVKVVDTTAAGDAFIGGLTVALLRGFELVEAVRYATCAGTLANTVLGAQTSLPSGAEVEAFYRDELS